MDGKTSWSSLNVTLRHCHIQMTQLQSSGKPSKEPASTVNDGSKQYNSQLVQVNCTRRQLTYQLRMRNWDLTTSAEYVDLNLQH